MADETPGALVKRHLLPYVEELLSDFRVVLVNGPRQSGKTTLLRQLHGQLGGTYYSLDRAADLQAARDDPVGLAASSPRPVFIDEVQRGGDSLVRGVKLAVDEFPPRPGSFILSGSSRFLTVPNLSESLAGRVVLAELLPLSLAEQAGIRPMFVEQLFADPRSLAFGPESPYGRADYLKLMCTGGFPAILQARSARGRASWFSSYVTTVAQRDIQELTRIRFAELLPKLLKLVAARTAQELNAAELARLLKRDDDTIRSYLPLLDMVYLMLWLPPWSRNLTAKVTRSPKVHMVDTGLAAYLMERSPASLARPGTPEAGALFETFVVTELLKQLAPAGAESRVYHYRDRGGTEVDCVIEEWGGRVVGIEIKLAQSINVADFRHLRTMRERLGSEFAAGVIFYSGASRLSFGDRLMALPASVLWNDEHVELVR